MGIPQGLFVSQVVFASGMNFTGIRLASRLISAIVNKVRRESEIQPQTCDSSFTHVRTMFGKFVPANPSPVSSGDSVPSAFTTHVS